MHDETADEESFDPAPNYFARRAIAVGLVVAAIAAAAMVVGWILSDDDGDEGGAAVDLDWSSVVAVNERSGRISISGPDGSGVERVTSGSGLVSGAAILDDSLVITGERGAVAVELTGDRARTTFELGDDPAIRRPSGTLQLLLVDDGTDAVVVGTDLEQYVETSAVVDAPGVDLAFESALANVDGTAVLLADVANFQSVLLRVGEDAASYFAGAPIAVDGDRVATAQNVGTQARVTISTHAGVMLDDVETEPVLAAMLIPGGLLTIDANGVVHRISDGEDEPIATLGSPPVAGASWVATSGDRLVLTTSTGILVIDPDGDTVASISDAEVVPTGPLPVSSAPMRPGCLVVQDLDTAAYSVVDLRDGTTTAGSADDDETAEDTEAPSTADTLLTSADGCTALLTTSAGTARLTTDGTGRTVLADDDRPVALSPDAETVLLDRDDRLVAEAVATDDPGSDGDDLGPATPYAFFADL